MFDTMPGPMSYIESKTLRPLAVTGEKRLTRLPDVPTFMEQGVPGMDIEFSYGIVAPKETPDDIISKLNRTITETLNEPAVRQRLSAQDVVPNPQSPEAYGEYLTMLAERWKKIVVDTGFKPMN
jgi:tripartite-type tricarboxylate transporter receptor subunit TctC